MLVEIGNCYFNSNCEKNSEEMNDFPRFDIVQRQVECFTTMKPDCVGVHQFGAGGRADDHGRGRVPLSVGRARPAAPAGLGSDRRDHHPLRIAHLQVNFQFQVRSVRFFLRISSYENIT